MQQHLEFEWVWPEGTGLEKVLPVFCIQPNRFDLVSSHKVAPCLAYKTQTLPFLACWNRARWPVRHGCGLLNDTLAQASRHAVG